MGKPPGPERGIIRKRGINSTRATHRSKTMLPPGPIRGSNVLAAHEIDQRKEKYLSRAREVSYMMQGDAIIRRRHSYLGGKFLRMYLDHELDPEVVEEAGKEIAASDKYHELEKNTNVEIQNKLTKTFHHMPDEKDVADIARHYLTRKKGIEFRGRLNPVIGGVTGVKVGSEAVFLEKTGTPDEGQVEYKLEITFYDTYDFTNKRQGYYDKYRKRLAKLLQENKFEEFEQAYDDMVSVNPFGKPKRLDNAAVFASFMYALEKRGWTPGPLSWHVAVPMYGTISWHKKNSHR